MIKPFTLPESRPQSC